MANILDTLHSQHEMVKKMFEKLEATEERPEKEKLFTEIRNALVPHIKWEEKLFYSVLEEKEEFKEDVLHGFEEHHAAKVFLKELEGMSPSGKRWDAKASVLKDMIEHHVETEEDKIFKAARETLSEREMNEIGDKFEDATSKSKTGRLTRVG